MIIQTRYRDVPFDEIECYNACNHSRKAEVRQFWESNRGREILVEVPAANHATWSGCQEPRYNRVNADGSAYIGNFGRPVVVCPHIAEIGD